MHSRQKHGCSTCRFAGTGDNISIAAKVSEQQYEELRNSGANYYCVILHRPVYSQEGITCSSWRSDD